MTSGAPQTDMKKLLLLFLLFAPLGRAQVPMDMHNSDRLRLTTVLLDLPVHLAGREARPPLVDSMASTCFQYTAPTSPATIGNLLLYPYTPTAKYPVYPFPRFPAWATHGQSPVVLIAADRGHRGDGDRGRLSSA